jgi:ferredoxin
VRVTVNRELCMGHTLCSVVGPDVFDLDERGHCLPLHTELPAALEAQAVQGAEACPERAIAIDR